MKSFKTLGAPLVTMAAVATLAAGCNHVDQYEAAVYDYEPVYCYKTLAGVQCYDTPEHRDERRIVNYYGPHPSRYEKEWKQPERGIAPPPPVDYFVRDPDPIPEAAPRKADSAALPWKQQAQAPVEVPVEAMDADTARAYAAEEAQRAREEALLESVRDAIGGI